MKQKFLIEITGALIHLKLIIPSQTVIGIFFAKPLAKGFRNFSLYLLRNGKCSKVKFFIEIKVWTFLASLCANQIGRQRNPTNKINLS